MAIGGRFHQRKSNSGSRLRFVRDEMITGSGKTYYGPSLDWFVNALGASSTEGFAGAVVPPE